MSFEIRDKKGRPLISMNKKGKLALSRYPDLSDDEINGIAKIYQELSGDDLDEVLSFLRFEEEEEVFCS